MRGFGDFGLHIVDPACDVPHIESDGCGGCMRLPSKLFIRETFHQFEHFFMRLFKPKYHLTNRSDIHCYMPFFFIEVLLCCRPTVCVMPLRGAGGWDERTPLCRNQP